VQRLHDNARSFSANAAGVAAATTRPYYQLSDSTCGMPSSVVVANSGTLGLRAMLSIASARSLPDCTAPQHLDVREHHHEIISKIQPPYRRPTLKWGGSTVVAPGGAARDALPRPQLHHDPAFSANRSNSRARFCSAATTP